MVDGGLPGGRLAPARMDDLADVPLVRLWRGGHLDFHDPLDSVHGRAAVRAQAVPEVSRRLDPGDSALPLQPHGAGAAGTGAELRVPHVAGGRDLRAERRAVEAAGGGHRHDGRDREHYVRHLCHARWLSVGATHGPDPVRLRGDHAGDALGVRHRRGGQPLGRLRADRLHDQRNAARVRRRLLGLELTRLLVHDRGHADLHARLHHAAGGMAARDGHHR